MRQATGYIIYYSHKSDKIQKVWSIGCLENENEIDLANHLRMHRSDSVFVTGMVRPDKFRLLVCGDREWKDREKIKRAIEAFNPAVIIHGAARGADTIAREIGEEKGLIVLPFPALWNVHGKKAGPIRNQQMLDEGKPDHVVACHAHLEESKGTKDMVQRAKGKGVVVTCVK